MTEVGFIIGDLDRAGPIEIDPGLRNATADGDQPERFR